MDSVLPETLFAPAERYFCPDIAKREREKIWPRTWLMAGRLEQIPNVGDYIAFDIDVESILIVRLSPDRLKAYYNVCQHRGRRLKDGCGNTRTSITCPFHGWRWNIDGKLEHVVNREDWNHCPDFSEGKLALPEVKVDTWGGWIFVSMAPDIEPLLDYLAPIPEIFTPYEFENCRMAWAITIKMADNWKAALNTFNENYHVETTHPQLNKFGLAKGPSRVHGRHAQFVVEMSTTADNLGSPGQRFKDMIETIQMREQERRDLLNALVSDYGLKASRRLREVLSPEATVQEVIATYRKLHREEMEAAGAKWPENITPEVIARAGVNWHVFPNFIFLPSIDGALVYRARPDPDNPSECFYDVWWLQRYGEGKAPQVEHVYYPSFEAARGVNPFLEQDFGNMAAVQKGIRSRGFRGCVYNPYQETEISNFEKVLDDYLEA